MSTPVLRNIQSEFPPLLFETLFQLIKGIDLGIAMKVDEEDPANFLVVTLTNSSGVLSGVRLQDLKDTRIEEGIRAIQVQAIANHQLHLISLPYHDEYKLVDVSDRLLYKLVLEFLQHVTSGESPAEWNGKLKSNLKLLTKELHVERTN